MALCRTSVLVVEQASQMAALSIYVRDPICLLPLGGSEGVYSQASFQITASVLGL